MSKPDLDRLLNKALQAPSLGGGCVISMTLPYSKGRSRAAFNSRRPKVSHAAKMPYLFVYFIFQNMSVELQLENHGEFCHDHFKMQVDKASGARYGTGVRDL